MTTSDKCIAVLKQEEGFSKTPYWDFTQYTVGFGTKCPSDMVDYYTQNGITEEEAETLLRNHLMGIERDLNKKIIDKYGLTLAQNQFDALVLFSFNCGTGWTYETGGTFHNAIANSATGNDLIRAFALWCSAGNQIRTYLLRRRLSEANMYINNVYSINPPKNYCYVLYDANGGVTSPRSQGYDSNLTAQPFPVATKTDYIFQGWFTAKTGGKKVETLDASVKSMTLYAQWLDGEGNAPPSNDASAENPVTVTVTGTEVNLRKGPGTNYTRVGVAKQGDTFVITEVATGSGYTWGKYDGGWIALQYTNYDAVINGTAQEPTEPTETKPTETKPTETKPTETKPTETKPTETKPTETKPTETKPTETKPSATEPSETKPSATKPSATEPPATKPPATEPPKVMGTVNVQDWLRIRSGPGTSYSIAGYLKPRQKVEILEQKTVGSMTWGKISEGWISMDYVLLDSNGSADNGESSADSWTGKIIADELLIRTGPGTNYTIVSYLTYGTNVTITEKKSGGGMQWGKIANGWICLNYVALDAASSGSDNNNSSTDSNDSDTTPGDKTVTGTVNVQDWLRIRSGPGTSYSVAGYLKPKEKVTITERKTVGSMEWGKISSGWISLDYVILDKGASSDSSAPQVVTKTIVADCLRVRQAPGTSNTIVGYLYYGAKVQILETAKASDGSLWGKVSNGWISMDYAK